MRDDHHVTRVQLLRRRIVVGMMHNGHVSSCQLVDGTSMLSAYLLQPRNDRMPTGLAGALSLVIEVRLHGRIDTGALGFPCTCWWLQDAPR